MKTERRAFLRTLLAATACAPSPSIVFAREANPPLSFSTIGCPRWDWLTILDAAGRLGYEGLTLRGIQGEMDLTKRAEFASSNIKQSVREVRARGLRIVSLGASTRLHDYDPAKRARELDEAKRFINLAHELNASYVRVFGDDFPAGQTREATIERVAAGLGELGSFAKGSGVTVLLESHGAMTDSRTLGDIFARAEMPTVGFLWDTGHTFIKGGERPAETFGKLQKYLRLVELRDVVRVGDKVRSVIVGGGIVPVREAVRVLAEHKYQGFYTFEWLKFYEPEIEEPEVALRQFPIVMRDYFAAAKAKR